MTTHRDTDDLEPYLYTQRALKIVAAAAASGMKPAKIAVELDVSESTIRMWKTGETVNVKTARKLRRLERRIGK